MNNDPQAPSASPQQPATPPPQQSAAKNPGKVLGIIGTVFNVVLTPIIFGIVMGIVYAAGSNSFILIMTIGTITTAVISLTLMIISLYLSTAAKSSALWGIISLITGILMISFYTAATILILLLSQL